MRTREIFAIVCLVGILFALIFSSYVRSKRVEKLLDAAMQNNSTIKP